MSKKTRVGIYGGTFNPPHIGHIRAAQSFKDGASLDKLLIMPTFMPPHKSADSLISSGHRLDMCRIAFSEVDGAEVSDFEIKRGGKSYTALTLSELYCEDTELYFLCGTDMFLTMNTWYKPDVIFKSCCVCYVRRENDFENGERLTEAEKKYVSEYGARILPITAEVTEASSTEIREKIKRGEDCHNLMPQRLIDYIAEKGLYK